MYKFKKGHYVKISIGENVWQTIQLSQDDIDKNLICEPVKLNQEHLKGFGFTFFEMSGKLLEVQKTIYPKPPLQCVSIFAMSVQGNNFFYNGKQIQYLHELQDEILKFENR